MLPDHKRRCPSIAPLLQPQRRKYVLGGVGVLILILGILLLIYIITAATQESFVLDRTPLFAGRNNLPQTLHKYVKDDLSKVDLNSDLSKSGILGQNCSECNTDFSRLSKGKVSSQFLVVRAGCNESTRVSDAIVQLDLVNKLMKKYPDHLQIVKNANDLEDVFENKKFGSIIAIDGGQALRDSTAFLRIYYELGVRALTISNECNNANDSKVVDFLEENGELTELGENVIEEMNRLGLMIDIQGLSPELQKTVLNTSIAPVMISHGAAAGMYDYPGNIANDTLQLLKSKNGLLMVTFDASFLSADASVNVTHVVKHVNFITDKIGYDNIAIGGNYDSLDKKPVDLQDVSSFPTLFKELKKDDRDKWTADNLDKLAGTNFKKFFQNVEKAKKEAGKK